MKSLTPEAGLIFRITHINNVRSILRDGVQCKSSPVRDTTFVSIGNEELIQKRTQRVVPVMPGGFLSDYVPFYFTPFSPMLYNIKTGHSVRQRPNEDIVIMVAKLPDLATSGKSFLFSDRHAYLATAKFYNDLRQLTVLPWDDLQNRDFSRDAERPDKMERYQAEALIHRSIYSSELAGIATYNADCANKVKKEIDLIGSGLKVLPMPNWYFR